MGLMPMQYEEVDTNLIWTNKGYGNTAAINLGNRIFIIDSTVNWRLAQEWKEEVEQYFKSSVSGLILTHHHADHTFGNQIFSNLPIISSTEIWTIMDYRKKFIWILEEMKEWEKEGYGINGLRITLPNICFDKKLMIHGEKSLELIRADGHTLGSTYLWEKETKTLIAGDLVFNHEFPYGGDETSDLIKWKAVIEELIKLNPKIIISGHGPPARVRDLNEIRDFFSKSIEFMKEKINEGFLSQDIVKDPHFPEYYSKDKLERKKNTIKRWIDYFNKIEN